MHAIEALRLVAFELERADAPTYRVRAFRDAAGVVASLTEDDLSARAAGGGLTALKGIGASTAGVIEDALADRPLRYLAKVREQAPSPVTGGRTLRAALRGDCHTHSDASDGGSPVAEMARTARELGHEWMVLTDHSPRLRIARGLSAERLRAQLDQLAELNAELAPFRVCPGIEVDILDAGELDQRDELLAELDVVVASAHSNLRMARGPMTERLVAAVSNPRVNVLGHCTGRLLRGRKRPPSEFDAEAVFRACVEHDVAVEINSRPDRLDPPSELLALARDLGCRFAIDSDAHAPGQLDWLDHGCARAERADIGADRVINTAPLAELLSWSGARS